MPPLIGITTHRRNSAEGEQDIFGLRVAYVDAVRNNGGLPVMIPLGSTLKVGHERARVMEAAPLGPVEAELHALFERLDGLVIPGGGDMQPELCGAEPHETIYGIDPDRDRVEMSLIRWAVAEAKPFLGICRGAQVMNVALGGTLYGDIASHAPNNSLKHNWSPGYPFNLLAHPVAVAEATRLAQLLGSPIVEVNSLHHQAIRQVASGVIVAAQAPDGIVEAIEVPQHKFALGVQWHPEWLQDRPEMRQLFAGLVQAAS